MGQATSSGGTSGAAPAGKRNHTDEASNLASVFFTALGTPSSQAVVSGVSKEMLAEYSGSPSRKISAVPPFSIQAFSPLHAPLIRAALQNDANLGVVVRELTGASKRFRDVDDFWGDYFARVAAALTAQSALEAPASDGSIVVSHAPTGIDAVRTGVSTALETGSSAATTQTRAATAAADASEDQMLLFSSPDTFCYKIPPRASASGFRAADWGLDKPLLTAYTRVVAIQDVEIVVAIWQRPSQSTALTSTASTKAVDPPPVPVGLSLLTAPSQLGHKLVGVCRIPLNPHTTTTSATGGSGLSEPEQPIMSHPLSYYLEPVADSSRYYVMRLSATGSSSASGGATVGLMGFGYADRQTAFDLKSSILDHVACVERQRVATATPARSLESPADASGASGEPPAPSTEFMLKDGETITIKLQIPSASGPSTAGTFSTPVKPTNASLLMPAGDAASSISGRLSGGRIGLLRPPRSAATLTSASEPEAASSAPSGDAVVAGVHDAESASPSGGSGSGSDAEWDDFAEAATASAPHHDTPLSSDTPDTNKNATDTLAGSGVLPAPQAVTDAAAAPAADSSAS